ncbi:MAG: c-type cytochrome biogenesis protein CcsB [Thermodesulfobacteriota bacterium]
MTSSQVLSYVTFVYAAAAILYWADWIFRKKELGSAATGLSLVGVVGNAAGFGLRWHESYLHGVGHIPLSNLYESLVFFSLTAMAVYLVVERQYKLRVLGAFVTPLAFLALAYASLSSDVNAQIQPLLPALKSNWLTAHVLTCFLGYAAFAVAFGLANLYLIKNGEKRFPGAAAGETASFCAILLLYAMKKGMGASTATAFAVAVSGAVLGGVLAYVVAGLLFRGTEKTRALLLDRLPEADVLDELMYQNILFGFLFLTVGIITGAVWANSAWGKYWTWDPKETWSLITWLIYAALIHMRLARGWLGARSCYFSIVGFCAVLFTWFGVNLLSGLHSYAR